MARDDKVKKPFAYFLPVRDTNKEGLSVLKKEELVAEKKRAPRGTGNPRKHGKGWAYIVQIPDPETGKKKRKWVSGFATKKEATAALRKHEAEIEAGKVSTWGDLTFKQYAEKFIKAKEANWREGTRRNYRYAFKAHCDPINDKRMRDITAHDIEVIEQNMIDDGVREPCRRRIHGYIKAVFIWGIKHEDIARSPYTQFELPKVHKRKSTAPTSEEIKQVLKSAEGTWLHLPILLGVVLGLRIGEVLGLQFGDIDAENGLISITRQVSQYNINAEVLLKTEGSVRTIPAPSFLIEELVELQRSRNASSGDRIVIRKGKAVSHNVLRSEFKEHIRKLGMDFRFHDLRHAFAIINLNNGTSLKIISDMLGHASINTTANIYCNSKKISRQTAEVMATIFSTSL